MATGGSNKAVIAALLANTGIALTKFIAFLLTGFSSMLAESIHSLADSSNQALLLVGGKRSQREATEEHPFGYGRERYIYAFIVSIVLFSLGGLFALYEAYHKFDEIHGGRGDDLFTSKWRYVPLFVLAIAMVLEGLSFRTAIVEGNRDRGSQSWWSFIRKAKSPELPVILLEDFAALIGLVVAFVAVSLALITSNAYFDVGGTAIIGTLLVIVAIILSVEVKSLLIGESATKESIAKIRLAIESTPGVTQIIHLKTLHIGPEQLLVAAKIGVEAGATAAEVVAAIDAAERNLRTADPMAQQVFLEPDVFRVDYRPGACSEAPAAPSR